MVGVGEDLIEDMGFEWGLEGCQQKTRKCLTIKEKNLCECVCRVITICHIGEFSNTSEREKAIKEQNIKDNVELQCRVHF